MKEHTEIYEGGFSTYSQVHNSRPQKVHLTVLGTKLIIRGAIERPKIYHIQQLHVLLLLVVFQLIKHSSAF